MLKAPLDSDPEVIADWIEASLLFVDPEGDYYQSDSDVSDALEDAGVADSEASLADAKRLMFDRMQILGPNYPFSREPSGWSITDGWEEFLPYSFLLLISLSHYYSELSKEKGTATEPSVILEYLTQHVVSQHFKGRAIRIGSKREDPVPKSFGEAISYAAEKMREQVGGRLHTSSIKDDGVDVIAWLPFKDKKPGQLALLMQCAIGKNWDKKLSDIPIKLWETHILWAVTPLIGIAVPFCLPLGNKWERVSKEAGIIFDRTRLVSESRAEDLSNEFADRIVSWSKSEIVELAKIAG